MTREELQSHVQQHEARCARSEATAFHIVAIIEFADGVLATLDTDYEFCVYFDKTRFCLLENGSAEDIGPNIKDFPPDIGLFYFVGLKSWQAIWRIARDCLSKAGGGEIEWHTKGERLWTDLS